MKKLGLLLAFCLIIFAGNACGNNSSDLAGKEEVIVFGAASLTESLTEIAQAYNKDHPDIKITFNFDSSGTLRTQIEEGAAADIFISAAIKQMDELADKVDEASRTDLLENEVVLASRQGGIEDIKSFEDLTKDEVKTIALGNADVPVGQYSEELLTKMGIWDEIQPKVSWGSNVKEVTSWVKEGAAELGIVYKTDAMDAGLNILATADSSNFDTPIIYPSAIIKGSEDREAVKDFYAFLSTDESAKIFESYGFKVID